MADFSTLIATLRATIKTNYNQEITGQILQDDLLAIVDAVNRLKQDTLEGYAFHGAPLADGASVSVTQNTFFLVAEGEYEINGSTIEVDAAGVSVIVYDSVNDTTNWYTLFAYDTTPTENSRNAITSGAVAAALAPLATKAEVEAVEQEVAQVVGEAGLAEAVIDTDGAGTEQEFTFRKSGGDGGAYYRKIKGKTIVVDDQLASNDAEAVETTGVNQWDEEWGNYAWNINNGEKNTSFNDRIASKNFIPVLPSTDYYINIPSYNEERDVLFYDSNYSYIGYKTNRTANAFTTPSNTAYIQFSLQPIYGSTYNHDICINLSNPAINGQYFPYWKRTLQLGITTRKDTDGNVPFADGMKGAGTASDWADKVGGEKRMGRINLGDLVWQTSSYGFYAQALAEIGAKFATDEYLPANIICNKYIAKSFQAVYYGQPTDNGIAFSLDGYILVNSESSPTGFLDFELATPVPFTWAEPLNLGVKVDENGTERAVAPEGATAPSAPFVADTTYTMSVARMVEKLQNL